MHKNQFLPCGKGWGRALLGIMGYRGTWLSGVHVLCRAKKTRFAYRWKNLMLGFHNVLGGHMKFPPGIMNVKSTFREKVRSVMGVLHCLT